MRSSCKFGNINGFIMSDFVQKNVLEGKHNYQITLPCLVARKTFSSNTQCRS